jgi:glyoxylase-like metal-dependent hydrolase (beta-lactamase superfamily II)
MDDIAEGLRGLRIGFVNVFAVTHASGSWTLIDAGIPFSASVTRRWAEDHFDAPPLAILLTHGHFDHVSGAADLAQDWNVPVYAHALEAPYLTGKKQYPPPNAGAGGGLMSVLSPIYPRGPVDLGKRLRLFSATENTEEIGALPDWQIVHTPGHTPGHVSFFRPADLTLIVGDAFCTTKPESFFDAAILQPAELHGPPAYFTADPILAVRSIHRLAALHPRVLAPGHGRPLAGLEVEEKLASFAADFDREVTTGDQAEGRY